MRSHFGKVFAESLYSEKHAMAKRTPPRSESNDAAPAPQARPKTRRSQAVSASVSMGSEPSEEDIRRRAYQRYLDRGGNHGLDFEDWLQAERELKRSKSGV
jgi:hypothetical protein